MVSFQDRTPPNSLHQPIHAPPDECAKALGTRLRFLEGVGPKRAAQLEELGLRTVEDLLYHLPFRYEDRRQIRKIGQAAVGIEETFIGELVVLEKRFIPRRRRQIVVGRLADESGYLELVWYRAPPYLLRGLSQGQKLLVHGKVEKGWGVQKKIVHPEFEAIDPADEEEREKILPVYLRSAGLSLSALRRWVASALAEYGRFLPVFLPQPVVRRQRLMDLRSAMEALHRPDKGADFPSLNRFASPAHRSVIFDEFFYLQLGLALRKKY
jgi:ATP-dependent DNA helicase RecG